MESKMASVEIRVSNLEKDIEALCSKHDNHEIRISDIEKSNLIMGSDISHIRDNLTRIGRDLAKGQEVLTAEIKDLTEKRFNDHYIKPHEHIKRRFDQWYGWIIGGTVAFVLGYLLNHFVK